MDKNIFSKVVHVLEKTLGVDAGGVGPESNLVEDLGADSLDLLDMTFQLEHEFGVRLEREELFPAWMFQRESEEIHLGFLTGAGVERAAREFPFLPEIPVSPGTRPKDLLTAGFLADFIRSRLQAGKGAA